GKADIAQPYLSQIETGKREGTIRTMKRIAEALGVQLDDLV
ncbi:MAG: helix-turn-helix domain-containing protein, partial [Parvibaculaceae bacterium]